MQPISNRRRAIVAGLLSTAALASGLALLPGGGARGAEETTGTELSVEQARAQVKMLDDLYKTTVVAITDVYKEGPPAVRVAHKVFAAMDQKGWHSARLVDASGAPLNEANEPKSGFEKRAAEAIQGGKEYYEEVQKEGDERRLLVATVVPAVLKRCAQCHGVEQGELLGFIRYNVPVK